MDSDSVTTAQDFMMNKLCPPPACIVPLPPRNTLFKKISPLRLPHAWIDTPFTQTELDIAIDSCKNNSAPGLDQFNYRIIRVLPPLPTLDAAQHLQRVVRWRFFSRFLARFPSDLSS